MNINGLGNGLSISAGKRTAKGNEYEEQLFFKQFGKLSGEKKKDSYDGSVPETLSALMDNYEYYSLTSTNRISRAEMPEQSAVSETSLRHISYEESDYIEVCVEQGYTYRAKVNVSGHSVYVEYRDEEGMEQAYLVDVEQVLDETDNPLEQLARASWNKVIDGHRRALGMEPQAGAEIGSNREIKLYEKRNAPYAYLADEGGIISYHGVTFVCDFEKNALCLGDMSNPNEVLLIPMESGGSLRVNRDNFGDLARAIGMFSAEDQNRIMRAIAQDVKVQKMRREMEEEESKVGEEILEGQTDGKEEL